MRALAGGAGLSILAAFLALVSFRQVSGGAAEGTERATSGTPILGPPAGGHPGGAAGESGQEGDRARDQAKSAALAADPCAGAERLVGNFRELYGQHHRFRHLIVLAPDPVEWDGSELFDIVLEGIEEAVSEDRGDGRAYVHDHQWLPWIDPIAHAARCWEKQPGVSLFRPLDGPGAQPPLLVLFVGENPIWGLRLAQFDAAVDLVRRHGLPAGDPTSPFLVLGPTFSGTASSLAAAVRRPPLGGSRVRIVSGTATTVKAQQILAPTPAPGAGARPNPGNQDPCAPPPPAPGPVSYESATATDACLLERMKEFLLARGGKCNAPGEPGNIVLFTETSTTYGSVGSESRRGRRSSCFGRWKLPPDLASIRKTSAKPDENGSHQAGDPTDGPLERAGSGEAARTLSPASVARHSLALGSTLDRLSNGRIRFAGIIATDPRDVLFLARRFRQELPDIRLFTLGASIQYEDPRAADALNGMFVVHSAPGDGNRSMTLQNELARKIYYAGRRLLTDEALEPQVHVSFVGNGRLWNIDDFDNESGRGRKARGGRRTTPAVWQFTFAFFTVVFIVVVVVVILGGRKECRRPRGRLWALVAPCTHVDLKRHDRAISAALILVVAGPLLLMLESMIARDGYEPDHWAVCVAAAALTLLVAWFTHIAGQRRTARPASLRWRGWRRWATFLPIAVSTIVLALALYLGCGPERRATLHLLSGGSPVLVGLIALSSYALALWCARARLRMLDTHRFRAVEGAFFVDITPPIAQALGERCGSKSGLADVERRLLKTLYHPWKDARVLPLAVHGILLLTIAVPLFIKPPHTLEPGGRHAALVALASVAILPASINLAWFLTTWTRFMRFLRRLASFPAVAALGGLPGRRAQPLEEQLAWSGSEATQLVHTVEILGRVAEVDDTLRAKHLQCSALLEATLSSEATRARTDGPGLVDVLIETSAELTARRREVPEATRARIDDFAASLVDLFIPRYVRHLRLFVPPMLLGCLCNVFLLSLYFVQPQRLIASIALLWAAVTVCVVLVSYVSLDSDPVVSAVSGSTAGKLTSRFALARKIVVWGAVPVASYLAVEHPEFPLWVSQLLDFVGKSLR